MDGVGEGLNCGKDPRKGIFCSELVKVLGDFKR